MQSIELSLISDLLPTGGGSNGKKTLSRNSADGEKFAGALDRGVRKSQSKEQQPVHKSGTKAAVKKKRSEPEHDDTDNGQVAGAVPAAEQQPRKVKNVDRDKKASSTVAEKIETEAEVQVVQESSEAESAVEGNTEEMLSQLLAAVGEEADAETTGVGEQSETESTIIPGVDEIPDGVEVASDEGETAIASSAATLMEEMAAAAVSPDAGKVQTGEKRSLHGGHEIVETRFRRVVREQVPTDQVGEQAQVPETGEETDRVGDENGEGKFRLEGFSKTSSPKTVAVGQSQAQSDDVVSVRPDGLGEDGRLLSSRKTNSRSRAVEPPPAETLSIETPVRSVGEEVVSVTENPLPGIRNRNDRSKFELTSDDAETSVVHLQEQARQKKMVLDGDTASSHDNSHLPRHNADSENQEHFSFSGISRENGDKEFALKEKMAVAGREKKSADMEVVRSQSLIVDKSATAGQAANAARASRQPQSFHSLISDENLLDQVQSGLPNRLKGNQTVTIKLWPENLGKVDVKLVMRDQQLAATFMVEQSEVKDAMMRKIDSLRDGLQLRGIDVKGIDIKITQAKAGDGPSVNVGDQHAGSFAWQQNGSNAFTRSDYGSSPVYNDRVGTADDLENLDSVIENSAYRYSQAGSLHIMA